MRRHYTIELKIEFHDEARYEQLKVVLARVARALLTSTMLLADGRKPVVMIQGEDWLEGINEEIPLTETNT